MANITLEKIHEDITALKKDIEHIKMIVDEDFELADEVVEEIDESRKRPKKEFISNDEMGKEFG